VKPTVFLTGATGFLGMEVLARLLEKGDREVVALVRAPDSAAAQERLEGVLAKLWRDPSPYASRVRAIAGDVTAPGLGMSSAERAHAAEEVGAVMHCAASISFDLPLEEARAINVEGTREVIGFAREAKSNGRLDRFIHVSTAYVAGITRGTFRERQLDAGQSFRNTYEQTKWEAEHVVNDAKDLDPVIARPSIVMGESTSGWTPAFNVLYWPIRAFSRGLFEAVPARPEALVDVVPVDYVADALVHLLEDTSSSGVVNLVSGRDACSVDDLIGMTAAAFGKERPPVVPPGSTGTGSARHDEHAQVYFPYFDMDMVFDDSRARSLLGPAGIKCPHLADYFPRLIEYAQTTRWGKSPLTREGERAGPDPGAEVVLGLPACVDEIAGLAGLGAQQLEAQEARHPLDLARPLGEALLELRAAALGDLDGVDLHDHGSERTASATSAGRSSGTKWPQPSRNVVLASSPWRSSPSAAAVPIGSRRP
jgi:thioester reductase-like protein